MIATELKSRDSAALVHYEAVSEQDDAEGQAAHMKSEGRRPSKGAAIPRANIALGAVASAAASNADSGYCPVRIKGCARLRPSTCIASGSLKHLK